jgi:predicted NAD/FAD-dependent oxidoreductase
VMNPLPYPFFEIEPHVYLIGDAFSGGGLDGAFRSGRACAEKILAPRL